MKVDTIEDFQEKLRIDNLRIYVGIKLKEALLKVDDFAGIESLANQYIKAQDDLILNGTNGASDESLNLFGFKRTK